ncbi:HlyD family secretion protein [Shewanella fidelis]|uniref:Efflux RND transporter periplasmic adaptor subunit n=1 Tax=Shewanella fidelis TaxID=173509 RepID=A0AAW8NT06_9GAMM|nr:efflux RND transporter periplasmic adaptor subunit [Shewanella fidelis]MDR8525600.1 efflux RND transporter periplasmic adaptor subunit [Shewanella fidelis]MDW4812890.1 efflux RND transporter periplasmic adaptor subunit [Shewanella fidelis]MDW4816638.1 efflux RND transporter periplasmic adaptor subunit [Shewanella fidelis]MDW4820198.1 efflux RND transporter periplasmic adaptor subunit [Shewanella fidelis]MDW4825355.1 efflux RND transporter periplasmic adaptor subunit [Shewanella fidelis]
MLEGLAVWALFIYLLRLVGMPWNTYSKAFAYLGGTGWLMFVWVGLLNYTPMDLSGGSLVQSPHIQLRPANSQIRGKVDNIYIQPNQQVSKGQLIYDLDPEPYQIALNKAIVAQQSAEVSLSVATEDVKLAEKQHEVAVADVTITNNQLDAANKDLKWKQTTLARYIEQNRVVPDTITKSQLDEQQTAVDLAQAQVNTYVTQIEKAQMAQHTALLNIEKSRLAVESRQADLNSEHENVAQAQWNLDNTKVYAPADGYVTNFIMREGQYVGVAPRMQMYTNEKYVLMRVNHQAIRNVKVGQQAEFASAVYPGKVFSAEVEGIVEATGESQGRLLAIDDNVRQTTGQNLNNKHHFVRLKLNESADYDIPVGSVGLAWISGTKPIEFLAFLDVIRGIVIRMKSQIYYFYSI